MATGAPGIEDIHSDACVNYWIDGLLADAVVLLFLRHSMMFYFAFGIIFIEMRRVQTAPGDDPD
jgi:hypothetical protein